MERKLKFRIWFKTENRWLETPDGLFFKYPHSTNGEYFGDFIHDPYFPQQFIGLEDKYHHEIYEGDIVRWTHPMDDIGEVKYIVSEHLDAPYPNQCYYAFVNKKRGICHFQEDDEYEVIGNIFENPKLLNYE